MAKYDETKRWPECDWQWGYKDGSKKGGEYLCKRANCPSCVKRRELKENKKSFREEVRPTPDETNVKEKKKEKTFECESCAHLYAEAKALASNVVRLRKDRERLLLLAGRIAKVMDKIVSVQED